MVSNYTVYVKCGLRNDCVVREVGRFDNLSAAQKFGRTYAQNFASRLVQLKDVWIVYFDELKLEYFTFGLY